MARRGVRARFAGRLVHPHGERARLPGGLPCAASRGRVSCPGGRVSPCLNGEEIHPCRRLSRAATAAQFRRTKVRAPRRYRVRTESPGTGEVYLGHRWGQRTRLFPPGWVGLSGGGSGLGSPPTPTSPVGRVGERRVSPPDPPRYRTSCPQPGRPYRRRRLAARPDDIRYSMREAIIGRSSARTLSHAGHGARI